MILHENSGNSQLKQEQSTGKQKKRYYIGGALGLLVVLLAVFGIFQWLNQGEDGIVSEVMGDELVFNHREQEQETVVMGDRPIDFILNLTSEELELGFPGLTHSIEWGRAFILEDKLLEVEVLMPEAGRLRVGVGQLVDTIIVIHEDPQHFEESLIYDVSVIAVVVDHGEWFTFQVDFVKDGFAYRIESSFGNLEEGQAQITEIVEQLISGGTEGMSYLADQDWEVEQYTGMLTLEEAYLDEDFGEFVPQTIPDGFQLQIASRSRMLRSGEFLENSLRLEWLEPTDYDYVYELYQQWVSEREGETLIPFENLSWFDNRIEWSIISVIDFDPNRMFLEPDDLILAENLNLEAVQARMQVIEWGQMIIEYGLSDEPFAYVEREFTHFGVLYGDILIAIGGSGVSAEQIWEMLTGGNGIR